MSGKNWSQRREEARSGAITGKTKRSGNSPDPGESMSVQGEVISVCRGLGTGEVRE